MHPHIPELQELYRQGKITRREFARYAALLGLSVTGITGFLAACKQAPAPTAAPTSAPAAGAEPTGPRRGGELRVSHAVQRLTDPAASSWLQFNIYRNVAEYLTVTDYDNVTHPWLLESWEPSDDLKTWTLKIRQGIKFNHGPELTADDVIFNFQRWLNPDTGSSMQGLLGSYLSANDVERVDDYTVRLHLSTPQVGVPEHLFHYPAVIMPKDFQGDWVAQPYGTGPFTLEEYIVDERAVVKAREGYWRKDANGDTLPYLDSIRFVYLGLDPAPSVAALTAGDVDLTSVTPPLLDALQGSADTTIASQVSSYTHVIRMRADREPFTDARVRNAIKACQDRQQILDATMRGYGALGEDFHVAPIHPEYCPLGDPPARDIEKAKQLLADAGYPDGLQVKLSCIDADPNITIAQLLKQQCEPAGINIELEMMPESMYWDQWLNVDFGITSWTHRPLATMTLALAYRTGVEWNETHWSNAEFDQLLTQAEGTLDLDARKQIMCKIEKILQDEGPVALPRWCAMMWAHSNKLQSFRAASSDHLFLTDAWLEG